MEIVNVEKAVQELKKGELVIMPTETVYGLAADGFNELAVKRIFEVKGRPLVNPFILHVSDQEMLKKCVQEIPEKAELLMEKFWPGPLTLLFKKSSKVSDIITAGLDTVCIRMPDHPVALKLIQSLGHPIVAPSANISSRPSPTSLEAAIQDLEDRGVEFALQGEPSRIGLESTVLDLTGEKAYILRLGGLAKEEIEKVLGEKIYIYDGQKHQLKLKSPGLHLKHYTPEGQIILVFPWETFGENKAKKMAFGLGKDFATVEQAFAEFYIDSKCGIICVEERVQLYHGYEVLSLGSAENLSEQAKNLFNVLLETEKLDWDKVIVDMTGVGDEKGLGPAIIERLKRAAETEL